MSGQCIAIYTIGLVGVALTLWGYKRDEMAGEGLAGQRWLPGAGVTIAAAVALVVLECDPRGPQ